MKGRAARCRAEYRIGHWKWWAPSSNNPIISGRISSASLDPQFSPSVGGDCTEGWGEDTVGRPAGCPEPLARGAGRREGIWTVAGSARRNGGRGADGGGVGPVGFPLPYTPRGSLVKNRKQFTPKINRYLLSL